MNTHENPTDLLTNLIPMIENKWGFICMLQNYIFGSFTEAATVA